MSDLSATIDHVVITVGDRLDAALAQYTRLGFDMTERGHHTLGSSNHLAIFGRDYLELLGYEPGRTPLEASQRADLHTAPPGLSGLVFKPDAPDFAGRLRAKGAPVGEAREFSRPVRLGEESRDARFRTASVTDPAVQSGRVFFCYHYTPELVWREEWRRHPNGVTGVAEFVIASGEPERMGGLFRRLFGAGNRGRPLPAGRFRHSPRAAAGYGGGAFRRGPGAGGGAGPDGGAQPPLRRAGTGGGAAGGEWRDGGPAWGAAGGAPGRGGGAGLGLHGLTLHPAAEPGRGGSVLPSP